MTREEKLTTMTMACLAEIAKRLGIKIDKKGAKAKAVAKILEAEAQSAEKTEAVKRLNKKQNEKNEFTNISDAEIDAEVETMKAEKKVEQKLVPMPGAEKLAELKAEYCGDGTPLAEVGKEIAKQAKEKSKKRGKSSQKPEASVPDKSAIISCIEDAKLVYKSTEKRRDILIYEGKQLVAVVYVGMRLITVYFNGESIKDMLVDAGCNVKESAERFDYYSRVDAEMLVSVIKALTA